MGHLRPTQRQGYNRQSNRGIQGGFLRRQGQQAPAWRAPTVMCLATDREQARIVLGYIRAYFDDIPLLKSMVRAETSNGLALKNGVDIVISTCDYRSVRGRAVALAIFDEAAFWPWTARRRRTRRL